MITTQSQTDIPVLNFNFQAPGFIQDPYPALHALRRTGPVVYHETLKSYMVTGWRDIAKLLGNTANFATDYDLFVGLFGAATMECIDDKERHDMIRGVWASDFQRPTLEAQREMVTEIIESRLLPFIEKVRSGETVDAVDEMPRGIPTLVIARMLGIPESDFWQFSAWSDAMGGIAEGATDPTPRGAEVGTCRHGSHSKSQRLYA